MKDFLYLVQARAELAEKHLALKSPNADVLIYTFDKKIDKPGFLYKPNTFWYEGRNILIEAAKKMSQKYSYYIIRDDDIKFHKGNEKGFEKEVLNIKPDLCQPLYRSQGTLKTYSKMTPFRYSEFMWFDCCFVCVSRELFFDRNLFPYEVRCIGNGSLGRGHHHTCWFWVKLFEYYGHKDLMVLNRFHIINEKSDFKYDNSEFSWRKLFNAGKLRDPNFSNKFSRQIPLVKLELLWLESRPYQRLARVIEGRVLKLPLDKRTHHEKMDSKFILALCKKLWRQRSYKHMIILIMSYLRYKLVVKIPIYKNYVLGQVFILGLWRDLKLNLRIWNSRKN